MHQIVGDEGGPEEESAPPEPTDPGDGQPDGVVRVASSHSLYPLHEDPELPPSTLTNTNLHHYLAMAMETQPGFGGGEATERPPLRSRLRRMIGAPRQAEFNAAVLHVLHQFDHRSRMQEHRIVTLEARLAAAERRRDEEPTVPAVERPITGAEG